MVTKANEIINGQCKNKWRLLNSDMWKISSLIFYNKIKMRQIKTMHMLMCIFISAMIRRCKKLNVHTSIKSYDIFIFNVK